MHPSLRTTLLATALMAAGTACAGSLAVGTLDTLTVTLVDLDPDDGIAPWISFGAATSRATAVVFQPFGVFDDDVAQGATAWGDVDGAVTLSEGRARATLQGAGADGDGAVLQASGQAAEPGGPPGSAVQYQAQVWAPYLSAGAFELSPFTAVTFTAQARLSALTQSSGTSRDYALAGAYLFLDGTGDVFSLDCDSVRGQQCDRSDTRMLSVSFANGAGMNASASFQAWTQAAGYSQALGVPEPAAALLLLGGLGVVAGAARRRQAPRGGTGAAS